MNKYRNQKTVVDGIRFDSKREAQRYTELCILLKAGNIKDLILQPRFLLQDKFRCQGKGYTAVTYVADFQYTETATGKVVVEDVKGIETEAFKIKKKLFLKRYGDEVDFRIVK